MADHQREGPNANPPYGGTQPYGYDPAQYAAYYGQSYGQQGYDPNSYYAYYGGYQQAGGAAAGAPPGQPPPPSDNGGEAPPPPVDGGSAAAVAALGAGSEAQQAAPPLPPDPSGQPPPSGPPGAAQQQGYYAQQQQQQQPGYGGYPAAGQQYDYSQYYAQQQYNQYYQQPGYGYGQAAAYQQAYGSYGQGAPPPQPPPTLPIPPGGPHASPVQQQPQQPPAASPAAEDEPAWKKAALKVAASAAAQLAQRSKQGQPHYNAVPPPGVQQRGPGRPGAGGFAIKAQAPKPRQQAHSPLVDAFNAAAAAITPAGPAGAPGRAAAAPAYLRVGDAGAAGAGPSQAVAAQRPAGAQGVSGGGGGAGAAASGSQAWPPSLKAWVERVFKLTDAKQRPKLQQVLKTVIQDATNKGELWTRDWDTMPLPDLSQPAEDAAAILSEVAAVSGPAAATDSAGHSWAAVAGGGIQRTSRWQQQQQQGQQWGGGGGENGSAAAAAWGGAGGGRRGDGRELSISPPRGGSKRGRAEDGEGEQEWGRGKQGRTRGRQGAGDRRRTNQADRHGASRRNRRRAYSSDSSSGYSSDASAEGAAAEHLSAAERRRRARRAGRFGDGIAHGGPGGRPVGGSTAEERRQRLQALLEEGDAEDIDWDSLAIKGTSQAIEKSYFRLTSAPDPSTVRPEPVLARALQRLVGLIQAKQVSYLYMLDQFKGMRQDCTVQHIRNELAVRVYEAHARAALEYGDVAEYNQCQSQVAVLYQEGVPGCRSEFLAYRIVYQAVHAKHGEILQLLNTLKRVSEEDSRDPDVAFALSVRGTLGAEDYPRFFRLYGQAPKLGRALMDLAIPKLRFAALSSLVKAFRPYLSVRFVASLLGFISRDKATLPASRAPTPEPPSQLSLPSAAPSPAVGVPGEVTSLSGRNGAVAPAGDEEQQQQQAGPQSPGPMAHVGAAAGADAGGSTEPLPGCADVVFVGKYAPKSDFEEGLQDCVAWLLDCAAQLTGEAPFEMTIDCKASTGQLKVPEDKTAVAHGDANLNIDDFLSKAFDAAI
ncbi:hypothetical protein N2152v2_005349 [Parachlorella kessleri]